MKEITQIQFPGSLICDFEDSKKLFELGVKQSALMSWEFIEGELGYGSVYNLCITQEIRNLENKHRRSKLTYYSAFNIIELIQILPREINGCYMYHTLNANEEWVIYYKDAFKTLAFKGVLASVTDESTLGCLVKMVILLLENGIIKNHDEELINKCADEIMRKHSTAIQNLGDR